MTFKGYSKSLTMSPSDRLHTWFPISHQTAHCNVMCSPSLLTLVTIQTHISGPVLANWAEHALMSAFHMNSLSCHCCSSITHWTNHVSSTSVVSSAQHYSTWQMNSTDSNSSPILCCFEIQKHLSHFTWLCRLAAIHMIFLHFSLVWTLFTFGFVKMAWPSTLLNQLSFCLAHHRDSDLCLVSSLSMSLGQSFQFLIRSRYSVQHLTPTSQWNLTPKLYPVPAFITSAHLNRFVRPWMTAWLVPWHLCLFHPVLIMLTLSYTVRRWRI